MKKFNSIYALWGVSLTALVLPFFRTAPPPPTPAEIPVRSLAPVPVPIPSVETVEVSEPVATATPQAQKQVWVNTRSGIYHYAGTRWYNATSQGEMMGEDDAIKAGYRAADNGQ